MVPERSKGLDLEGDNKLAKQEQLTVAAKGRVWAVKEGPEESFNIICMNQSANDIALSYSQDSMPWLAQTQATCTEKGNNLFSCTGNDNKPGLMCRTQQIANNAGGGITDMTAVALRSLDNSDQAFYRIANSVMAQHKLHFDLCQDMHGKHSAGGVSFVIQATGEVENVEIISEGELATPTGSQEYAQCMAQAIDLWHFPSLDYIYEMEYAFIN